MNPRCYFCGHTLFPHCARCGRCNANQPAPINAQPRQSLKTYCAKDVKVTIGGVELKGIVGDIEIRR